MKGIINEKVELKEMPDYKSPTLKTYEVGEIVEINEAYDSSGWCRIPYNGTYAFINFEPVYLTDEKYVLLEKQVNVTKEPHNNSEIISVFGYGKNFFIIDVVEIDNQRWIKVREYFGNEGFIPYTTQIQQLSKFVSEESSIEKSFISKGVFGGILMIVIAAVWFFGSYFYLRRIFFYPPILFCIGIYAVIRGIQDKNLKG